MNEPGCHLHDQEEGDDAEHGDGEPREALVEESVGECHQEDELRDSYLEKGELVPGHDAHVGDGQEYGHGRAYPESQVDRDVIDQVGQQQVVAEESGCQEEIVHGVELYLPERGEKEDQEEEEEERDGGEIGHLAHPGAGIQLLRHHHANLDP